MTNPNIARKKAAKDLKDYLTNMDRAVLENTMLPYWNKFRQRMMLEYGIGDIGIKHMLSPWGLTLDAMGQVVKIEPIESKSFTSEEIENITRGVNASQRPQREPREDKSNTDLPGNTDEDKEAIERPPRQVDE